MIYVTENNESGQLHTRKPPVLPPAANGQLFAIRPCGLFWEVRCVTRSGGKITGDQLVAGVPSEQEAEALARELADPQVARDRGRRVLEELLEEDA